MNDTYNPTLTIINFLAVERLARVYPIPCTPEVDKRTALGVAVWVMYDIAVRDWPDLACQKVVDVGGGYILLRTDREGSAATGNRLEDLEMQPRPNDIIP